jgi:O-antigen/teichoic acid export membrane protein
MLGNFGSKAISLLMLPFYTKWLTLQEYGTVDLIGIYATLIIPIATLAISEAIFIFPKNQGKEKQCEYLTNGIIFSSFGLILTAIIFIITNYIFLFFNAKNIFTEFTWLIYWLTAISFSQSFFQQFSRSIDKIKIYSITGIILTLFTAFFGILLIPKYGVFGYVISQIGALFISSIYTFFFSRAYSFFKVSLIKKSTIREMLIYSTPLIPNSIMWWLISSINRPIMEEHLGLSSIGLFSVANKLPSIISMVFSIFFISWQISVIDEFKKSDFSIFYNRVLRFIFVMLVLISCFMAFFSKILIIIFADNKFIDAWQYIPLLTLSAIFASISGLVGANFSATRESKYYFYTSLWGAVASVVFNLVLIPKMEILGAVLSILFAYIIMAVMRIYYSWKYVKIDDLPEYALMIVINVIIALFVMSKKDTSINFFVFVTGILFIIYLNRKHKTLYFQLLRTTINKVLYPKKTDYTD